MKESLAKKLVVSKGITGNPALSVFVWQNGAGFDRTMNSYMSAPFPAGIDPRNPWMLQSKFAFLGKFDNSWYRPYRECFNVIVLYYAAGNMGPPHKTTVLRSAATLSMARTFSAIRFRYQISSISSMRVKRSIVQTKWWLQEDERELAST